MPNKSSTFSKQRKTLKCSLSNNEIKQNMRKQTLMPFCRFIMNYNLFESLHSKFGLSETGAIVDTIE
jgi:hypothetical protein